MVRAITPQGPTASASGSTAPARAGGRRFPVVEVFGPTIQGEGPDAGRPCWFVRFGGCDFRCSWCDSMHAVTPALVRQADRMTAADILNALDRLRAFDRHQPYIVLSGGNPALHELGGVVALLHSCGAFVSVETQGSVWRDWLMDVDRLVVSPKPPSSGMVSPKHDGQLSEFMDRATVGLPTVLKIVIADAYDLGWARAAHDDYPGVPLYLSACTPTEVPWDMDPETWIRMEVGRRYAWLCEAVAGDPDLGDAVVLPQLHVIAWGLKVGV